MKTPRAPALLLGIGLGGFIDCILLHQMLQWHHMLTSTSGHPMTTVAGLEALARREARAAPTRAP